MKPSLSLALGSVLCLILAGCTVTSDNPLSSPDTAQADQRLVGDWFSKKDKTTFHFTVSKGGWMHVKITQSNPGGKTDSYDFFPTTIGSTTFLNVQNEDDDGHHIKGYILLRYTISGNHVLQMWMASQDEAAAAVRAGKLKGIVHENKNSMVAVGNPPHPDVDVTLQDSPARLVKFIQGTDVEKFFSNKMEPLTRIKP